MSLAAAGTPSGAASSWRCFKAQLRVELVLLLRQPENLLVILVLPVLLLALFAGARIFPRGAGKPIDFLVPGVVTIAIMSTGMVTLAISTAYQRYYRVLKRLGGTPLPRAVLVSAKAASVLLVEVVQVGLLLGIGWLGFGWRPLGSPALAVPVMVVGAWVFAALGLVLAGSMRAERTLGAANGLYLLFLVVGGVVLPLRQLPGAVRVVAQILPPTALSGCLRAILEGGAPPPASLALLIGWALVASVAGTVLFRWE